MPLISPTEQLAMERGEELGKELGLKRGFEREKQLVIRLIKRKLGEISSETESQIKALNIDDVEKLGEDLFDLTSINDLQSWLLNLSSSN
jgi:hypothetical protein